MIITTPQQYPMPPITGPWRTGQPRLSGLNGSPLLANALYWGGPAAIGAGVGALLGLLFRHPGIGAAIGGTLGFGVSYSFKGLS